MKRVFISYRRGPSTPYARQIYDELSERIGRERVFFDIDTLEPGTDFLEVIERHIDQSGLMLVIMDPTWSTVEHPNGNLRLQDEDDPVRMEVSRALERKLTVLPVLVAGAKMPNAESLPENLKPFVRRQAYELTDTHWADDMDELVKRVASSLEIKRVKPARKRGAAADESAHGFLKGSIATSVLTNVWRVGRLFQAHPVQTIAATALVGTTAAVGVAQLAKPAEHPSRGAGLTYERLISLAIPVEGCGDLPLKPWVGGVYPGATNEFGAAVTASVVDLQGEGDPEAIVGDFTGDGANDGVVSTVVTCGDANASFGGTYAFDSDGTLVGALPPPAQPTDGGTLGARYIDLMIVEGGIEGTAIGLAPGDPRATPTLAKRVRFEWGDATGFAEKPATTDSESALASPSTSDTGVTPSTSEETAGTTTTSVEAGAQQCAPGVSAGGVTSCAFANNVARAYRAHPGDTVTAYSPVTQRNYTMTCTAGSPVVCTGGRDAIVYIELGG